MESFAAGFSCSGVSGNIGMRPVGARDIGGEQVEVVLRLDLDLVKRIFLGGCKERQGQRGNSRQTHDGDRCMKIDGETEVDVAPVKVRRYVL